MRTFLQHLIEGDWLYLWIDATYLKVREAGRIVSVTAIIAIGANSDGRREMLGMHIGASEAEPFWTEFPRSLMRRYLRGVRLVNSDSHEGLKAAVRKVMRHLAALPRAFHAIFWCTRPPASAAGCRH